MTIEQRGGWPFILPSIGILSEEETANRIDYFHRVCIVGLQEDLEGNKYFILALQKGDDKIVRMEKDRTTPANSMELERFQNAIDKIKNEKP